MGIEFCFYKFNNNIIRLKYRNIFNRTLKTICYVEIIDIKFDYVD